MIDYCNPNRTTNDASDPAHGRNSLVLSRAFPWAWGNYVLAAGKTALRSWETCRVSLHSSVSASLSPFSEGFGHLTAFKQEQFIAENVRPEKNPIDNGVSVFCRLKPWPLPWFLL